MIEEPRIQAQADGIIHADGISEQLKSNLDFLIHLTKKIIEYYTYYTDLYRIML